MHFIDDSLSPGIPYYTCIKQKQYQLGKDQEFCVYFQHDQIALAVQLVEMGTI